MTKQQPGVPPSRHVLITGGSSGIGAALVRRFLRERDGWTVSFTYNHGHERARALVAEMTAEEEEAPSVSALELDLQSLESVRALPAALPRPVDVLINNAGVGTKTVEHLEADAHLQDAVMMQVNAVGTLWLTRLLMPAMLERARQADRPGAIVILSSVGGGVTQFPNFRLSDGMSKAALAHLGRQLGAELAHKPLDVYTVCPGAVDTPMFRQSTVDPLDDTGREALLRTLPDGRMIEPEEMAELIYWLCTTPAARTLRGSVLDASLGLGVHPGALTGRR
jgi:NAD(P)-dependent dehydrogenase (short-subunit alcohol dehydrogenase family)